MTNNDLHVRIRNLNSLRRRFDQNQQDVSYTIMALLPTLGTHIIEGMDVEGITQELQSHSRASKARIEFQPPPPPSVEDSIASSLEIVQSREHDIRSDNGSVSALSSTGIEDVATSDLGSSSMSWVDPSSSAISFSQLSAESPAVAGPSTVPSVPPEQDLASSLPLTTTTTTTTTPSSASSAVLGEIANVCLSAYNSCLRLAINLRSVGSHHQIAI